MIAASETARLKVTLDDVEPLVLRRIEVPLTIRLDRLHAVLQVALGWTGSHLWEFRARDVGWGIPDPGWDDGPHDAGFDLNAVDMQVLQERLAKLAKSWSRSKSKPPCKTA